VTHVIGGLGSDTFNVTGDVNDQVFAADLAGRSVGINHRADTDDVDYRTTLLGGLTATVADAEQGAIVIKPTGSDTTLAEGGLLDSYTVSMAADTAPITGSVFVTISAGIASRQDRRLNVPTMADGTQLTLSGSTITRDSGTWDADGFGDWQGITLTGAGDNSGDYNIVSIDGRMITIEGTFANSVNALTGVVAGASVSGQIAATVEMSADGSTFTNGIVLEFNQDNWDDIQTVQLRAIDDAAEEGARIVLISHAVDSVLPEYDGAKVTNLVVNVNDNDLPEVKLTESGPDTFVHEGGMIVIPNPDYDAADTSTTAAPEFLSVDTAMTTS